MTKPRKGKNGTRAPKSGARGSGSIPVTPIMAKRYVAAPGAPFSDDDAEVIGSALAQIAGENLVDEIRSLDKHLVFDAVEADEAHPLRRFYNWDDAEAARLQRIDRTAAMIRGIRVVQKVKDGKREPPQPVFFYVPDHPKRKDDERTRRGHVLRDDLLANDPAFMSGIAAQIRQIHHAVSRLEHLTSSRTAPREVVALVNSLRNDLTAYFGATASDAAAE